ncbi:PepSY-associated TM helix family protein 5 [Achromobacter xylosoxidans A8]|uniref:PepSY-associated TM helix family protein 5 n=1 Tax=Achromobacter xylosoxidans (strain A8) TaxID=762376 RepID=E3HVV4_ACHXA|nr:PepSY-associated TM helix domain-containing protein [Achromobacter xylosoxidans]ADP16267.1 PepSY-associated TM helix family protein 5 [Achromobacter xylosoxidans A8]
MSWLHTWCGLTCGWLLCAIFLTGTLSVFREPITRWMEAGPPPAPAAGAADARQWLARATQELSSRAAAASAWDISLPAQPGWSVQLSWRTGDGVRHEVWLDSRTGAVQPAPQVRETEGGRHFMSFHYTLHGGLPGYWLVGWISMCMLVALVSGVVVHKRIFKDFFTFRPGKGLRSWLDAHNATAVLTLPFLFMIGYTGLAFFYSSYMPWPLHAAYGDDAGAYRRYQAELAPTPPAPRIAGQGVGAVPDLYPLLSRARELTGQDAARITIDRPGDARSVVLVSGRKPLAGAAPRLLTESSRVAFAAASGTVLQLVPAHHEELAAKQVHETIEALHKADFGGWTIKWLYFFSGLIGTAMIAIGTLLFSIKRRKKSEHEFGEATARVYRCVEALNVAALAGIALASIAYFYGNRLIPAAWPDRSAWEIRFFFAAWAATLVHALWRAPRLAWIEQLAAAAVLCLGLPILNWATTGRHLWAYAVSGEQLPAAVELTALASGLLLAYMVRALRRHWKDGPAGVAQPPRKAQAASGGAAAHRWGIVSRVVAAAAGGYLLSALAMSALALTWPAAGASPAVGVLAATLLSFVVYTAIGVGVFGARSAGRAWALIAVACLMSGVVVLGLRA